MQVLVKVVERQDMCVHKLLHLFFIGAANDARDIVRHTLLQPQLEMR